MTSKISAPAPLVAFYAHFPLKTLPAVENHRSTTAEPTLWIQPSPSSTLSSDVDCLVAQALLALLGHRVALRTDITHEGSVDGHLPTLQLPDSQLLPAHAIPNWAGAPAEDDESQAWSALLRSAVRPAQLLHAPPPTWAEWARSKRNEWQILLSPPPPPATGIGSALPALGTRIDVQHVINEFGVAVKSLAERLGRDQWFLGSPSPTALDANIFAHLHCASRIPDLDRHLQAYPALNKWMQHVHARILAAH